MIGLHVRGADEAARRISAVPRDLDEEQRRSVVQASIVMRRKIVERLTGKSTTHPFWGKQSPSGAYLGSRGGGTRARISPGGQAFKVGNRWIAAVGSPDAHVKLHEEGGTVQGNQYLRIPTAAAQKPSGEDRWAGLSAVHIPGSFIQRLRKGSLWIMQASARKSGRVTFLYLLVRRVVHRGRGMLAAVAGEMPPVLQALGLQGVGVVVRKANG